MKKCFYLAGAAIGLALTCAPGRAADLVPDLSAVKDPLPDSLSLGGITLYGTIDVGYAYQTHGVPLSASYLGGLEYQAFTTTRNFAGSQATPAESGLEQSKIGVRVDQPVVAGLSIVGRIETGFNPLSGQLTDACEALATNSGVAQGHQTANADSSRCGQAINGVLYGGISSPTYGTLTIGRHNSLELDALAQYDPQTLSYAFSFLGYSGFDGGAGSTQAARWDNAVKYAYANGPVRVSGMYTPGGSDTGILGRAVAVDGGLTYLGFSLDGVYENMKGAINLRSSFDNGANPLPTPGLAAYISDDTSYNVMGKYTFDLPNRTAVPNKLTAYAGYSHIEKAHGSYSGGTSEGNYAISVGININDSAIYNVEWVGAKLVLPSGFSFSGGYYHIDQNSWTIGLGTTGTQGLTCSAAGLLCAGDFNEASLVVDYAFNKHYDIYAGVNYSVVTDGLANGFVGTTVGTSGSEDQLTFMAGFRLRI